MNTIEKLIVDDGLLRLDINGNGVLCFNPTDLNLYERLCTFVQDLPSIEAKYEHEVEASDEAVGQSEMITLAGKELSRAKEIDAEVKARLRVIFGPANDFDVLLGGVNIMAFGSNGERVITNLLNALTPYMEKGAKTHMQQAADAAKSNRQQRRAQQRGGSQA